MNMNIKEEDTIRHKTTKIFYRVKKITIMNLVDLNSGRKRNKWVEGIDGGDTKVLYTVENCDTNTTITEHQFMMHQYELYN